MPHRITVILFLLALTSTASAQGLHLSHPYFRDELLTWNYDSLLDCSIRYEVTIGIYEKLSDDPEHFAAAIENWQGAQDLYFELGQAAAVAQGLSDADLADLYAGRKDAYQQPAIEHADNKKALADVAVGYMNDAKKLCTPYFEELKPRIGMIEQKIR